MMKAKQWPNGLGWDIGAAEIRNCNTFLRAFVPITPETGARLSTGKSYSIDRHKRQDFPLGTDPVECVQLCKQTGTVHYDQP